MGYLRQEENVNPLLVLLEWRFFFIRIPLHHKMEVLLAHTYVLSVQVSLQLKIPQIQHHCYLWRASKYFCPSFKMAAAPAIAPVLFNPATLMLFFKGADAMALSNRTRLHLAIEGILVPNNFKTLTTTDWMTSSLTLQSFRRLRQLARLIARPDACWMKILPSPRCA